MESKELTREIMQKFLQKHGKSNYRSIARFFDIPMRKNYLLTQFLNNLIANNYIFYDQRSGEFYVQKYLKTIQGTLQISKPYFGFIQDQDDLDASYYVAKDHFNSAFDGDQVEAHVYEYEGKQNAVIIKIIKRSEKIIIGKTIKTKKGIIFAGFYDKDRFLTFKINNIQTFDIKENWLVRAKVIRYHKTYLTIDLLNNLSPLDDNKLYVEAKLNSFDLDLAFNNLVLEQANQLPDQVLEHEIKNRNDFRHDLVITIDGDDTKDFDDAISVFKNDDGTFNLNVHIADVSYYVTENSEIDLEALKRGTSIYLADRVIPMLPEKLSNGICSLNPNVDRLAMSAIITIDQNGNNIKTKLCQSIINSKYRLTYNQVNDYYKNKNNVKFDQDLSKMLDEALELANILRTHKEKEGYINFEIEEPKIVLDDNNKVIDIVVKHSGISENMIEDFMVRANESVAYTLNKAKLPVVFRIHEQPDIERVENANANLQTLGIKSKFKFPVSSLEFAKTVRNIETENNDQFLKIFFLRTMPKAVYSTFNIGHFGLASKYYCHFTSPIRRYPDLLVHRVIRDYYLENKKPKNLFKLKTKLELDAKRNSDSEQQALTVERSTNDIRYAEYYESRIGKTFKAKVSTILKFGMFVELETHISVLCHIKNMTDGEYVFNEKNTSLEAPGKTTYKIGDNVNITIVSSSLKDGKIDCVLSHNYEDFKQAKAQLQRKTTHHK